MDGTASNNDSNNDANDEFPEEFIPDDKPKQEDPIHEEPIDPESMGRDETIVGAPQTPASNTAASAASNKPAGKSAPTGAIVGIAVSAAVCILAVALLVGKRRRNRKERETQDAFQHADASIYSDHPDMVVPLPNTKTRRYRDFLEHPDTDPDVPNMGGQRPRGSYHDHVFDNVDLI